MNITATRTSTIPLPQYAPVRPESPETGTPEQQPEVAAGKTGTASEENSENLTRSEGKNAQQEKPSTPAAGACKAPDGHELSREELRQLQELEQRDREVKAHEHAHIAAGGRYVTSGASYKYETGPDGRKYATGGEVSIDTSEEKDPRATIRKMETVRKAALAPARPSSQDRRVAAQASRKIMEAEAELRKSRSEETKGSTPEVTGEQESKGTEQAGDTEKIQNTSPATTEQASSSTPQYARNSASAGSMLDVYV